MGQFRVELFIITNMKSNLSRYMGAHNWDKKSSGSNSVPSVSFTNKYDVHSYFQVLTGLT